MKLQNVKAIYRKDLFDAIKDARILVALIVPFGLALLYNFMFDDETPLPEATVAYTNVGSVLPERLAVALEDSVELRLEPYDTEDDVRQVIADEDAAMGLVIPEDFDGQVEAGESPPLLLLFPDATNVPITTLAGTVDLVTRQMAEVPLPVEISQEFVAPPEGTGPSLFDDLGLRLYFVLAALIMMLGMIGVLAVPIILAEEAEKKTLEALTLIASYLDVVVAKALVGMTYMAVGSSLLLIMTRTVPEDPVIFASGIILLGIVLVGIGLLIGGLFRNANQLNNWSGIFLGPIIAPAFITGVWTPGALEYILDAIPVTHGMKLAVNGMSGEAIFADMWLSYLILVVWIFIAYGALIWRLSRLRN